MESTTRPSAEIKDSIDDRAPVRLPNDSDDVVQPADEASAFANTDIMDTRGDEALMGPSSDSQDILEPANESPTVSSSISIDSRTSTLKYSQEPFDRYQTRVKELCHILWLVESRVTWYR